MVLPRQLREDITTTPGEILIRRSPDGLLLSPVAEPGILSTGTDGLPVLRLGHSVTNDEVLGALDRERTDR